MEKFKLLGVTEKELSPGPGLDHDHSSEGEFEMVFEKSFDPKSDFRATISFSKSVDSVSGKEVEKYRAVLKYADQETRERSKVFFLFRFCTIYSFKEAYNLLQGRAVLKTHITKAGVQYQAWAMLDLQGRDRNGEFPWVLYPTRGFNVKACLLSQFSGLLPRSVSVAALVASLERGNVEVIPILKKEGTYCLQIQANPRERRIETIYYFLQ